MSHVSRPRVGKHDCCKWLIMRPGAYPADKSMVAKICVVPPQHKSGQMGNDGLVNKVDNQGAPGTVDLGSQAQKVARREGIQVVVCQWQTRAWCNMTFRDMSIGVGKTRQESRKGKRVMYRWTWLTCKVGWKNKKAVFAQNKI